MTAERIDGLQITENDCLASLDVQSLFTKVPIEQTTDIVHSRLTGLRETEEGSEELESITSLTTDAFLSQLRLVMEDFYFTWKGTLYRQRSGLPMGSRLSPVLANIFMEEIENVVLNYVPNQTENVCALCGRCLSDL